MVVCFSGCPSPHRRRDSINPARRRPHPCTCHLVPLFRAELPSPPLPREGGSNGGNRRAVSPLAVGEGFQRKPPRNRFPLALFLFHLSFCRTKRKVAAGGNLIKTSEKTIYDTAPGRGRARMRGSPRKAIPPAACLSRQLLRGVFSVSDRNHPLFRFPFPAVYPRRMRL